MTIPNADRALIAAAKLTGYLLHKRGAAKARLLLSVGYRADAPQILEADLRRQHLTLDVTRTSENAYGVVYEIDGPIKTPSGKTVRFCSIWQSTLERTCPDSLPCTRGRTCLLSCTAT